MSLVLFGVAVLLTLTINIANILFGKESLHLLISQTPLLVLLILILDAMIVSLWQVIGMVAMYRWLRKDH